MSDRKRIRREAMSHAGKKIWSRFRQSTSRYDHPSQIAMGVCLGMLVGILPKDSLLPWAIGCFAILSPANLTSTTVLAILCTLVGTNLDWLAHPIGLSVLTHESLQPIFGWLQGLPIVPWTRFENSVVMGLLVIGLTALLPLFLLSYLVAKQIALPPENDFDQRSASESIRVCPQPTLMES